MAKITNKKRKKGKKEEKKFLKNYKRGTSLEFQPFQFIFFFNEVIGLEILFLKSCLKVNGLAVFSIHIN